MLSILGFLLLFVILSSSVLTAIAASDITLGVKEGDSHVLTYTKISTLDLEGNQIDYMEATTVGGKDINMTAGTTAKITVESITDTKVTLKAEVTYKVKDRDDITEENTSTIQRNENEMAFGSYIQQIPLITINKELLKQNLETLKQNPVYPSLNYTMNGNLEITMTSNFADKTMTTEIIYDLTTGWLQRYYYKMFNSTHTVMEVELKAGSGGLISWDFPSILLALLSLPLVVVVLRKQQRS